MKRAGMLVAGVIAAGAVCGFAKSPQQLKAELTNLLPPGKKARVAWMQTDSNLMTIKVVDSDDGIIRELTPRSMFSGQRTVENPCITHDGSRVIFSENNSGKVYVVNWDGTGVKSFNGPGYFSRYWRDRVNNSDWAIFEGAERVNVDAPTQVVGLGAGGDRPWYTLSNDGTHLAYTLSQEVAIYTVPSGPKVVADSIGCRVNMAPDNSYNIVFQTPYHTVVRMCDSNGVKMRDYRTNDDILLWAGANGFTKPGLREHDQMRWTSHRDYITFYINCTTVNPFIVRLSDLKWVYLVDSLGSTGWAGNTDMVVLDTGSAPAIAPSVVHVPDCSALLNSLTRIIVFVNGRPEPSLAAQGLPPGLSVINGPTPASSFVIHGAPTQEGVFPVTLTPSNSEGNGTETFTMTVVGTNQPPVASAGADTTIRVGYEFSLNGGGTDDGLPFAPLTYLWEVVSVPSTGVSLSYPMLANTRVSFAVAGTYLFRLTASDGALADDDTVAVTVQAAIPFRLLVPAGGSEVKRDSAFTVSWQIDPPSCVNLLLSTNGGLNYVQVNPDTIPAGQTSWVWQVPDTLPLSTNCYLRIGTCRGTVKMAISGKFSIVDQLSPARPRAADLAAAAAKHAWEVYSIDGRRLDPGILSAPACRHVRGLAVLRDHNSPRKNVRIELLPQ